MAERFQFSVTYDEAAIKSAVRGYFFRALLTEHTWTSVLAFFGIVVCAGLVLFARHFDFLTGVFAGLLLAAIVGIAFIGLAHWRGMKTRLARLKSPLGRFALTDKGVEIVTDAGAGRYDWETIRQIWKFNSVWLLMFAKNQFVTLPLAGVPAEALAFLESRVQPRPL